MRLKGAGSRALGLGVAIAVALVGEACSVRSMAVNSLADSLASAGTVYASDEDPELVRDALPFALKTYESLLAEAPDHLGLLLASCSGFTQYARGFVEADALEIEESDWEESERLAERALKLYLRARDYCLRGLEIRHQGIGEQLRLHPEAAVEPLDERDLALVYWTGASWGAAISAGLDHPELVVDLPAVQALMAKALEIDEAWGRGSIHEVLISLESLPEAMGGSPTRAREHFSRAVELSEGRMASPYLSLAGSLSISEGNRQEFIELLQQALAVDATRTPEARLANLLAQERARFLMRHVDDYFLPEMDELDAGEGGSR